MEEKPSSPAAEARGYQSSGSSVVAWKVCWRWVLHAWLGFSRWSRWCSQISTGLSLTWCSDTHTHTQREGEREHMFICYIKHTRIQMLYNTNQLLLTVTSNLLHIVTSISHWFFQVVEDISQPLPFDVPMVLIKPPQGCATAEVYKVI